MHRLSVDLYPEKLRPFQNIWLASQYIYDELKATGAEVFFQDAVVQEATYRNVIARFGPKAGPLLVIGAHYDSFGDANVETGTRSCCLETHTPGADDNASGVAGLIELSRLLGRKPPTRAIELVAYALEEPLHFRTEHMGSVWHARVWQRQSAMFS